MPYLLIFFCCFLFSLSAASHTALYNSLDPYSISEHLAFYELYKDTEEGKRALQDAWRLLAQNSGEEHHTPLPLALQDEIAKLIQLIHPHTAAKEMPLEISEQSLTALEQIAATLPNRRLKGYYATSQEELLQLTPEEIDLAHGLFLLQFPDDPKKVKAYEAAIDFMALQILARCPFSATNQEKIIAINNFIFFEMEFRFPPHSTYADTIDHFTFLSSVLESRRGVCLGVSVLYLAIAQRMDLPLTIITPPGHIFLSDGTINIETTARGIHIPLDEYYSLTTKMLKKRTMKEVLGMVWVNQASLFLSRGDFEKAAQIYEQALPFMPNDSMLQTFLGCSYLLSGKEKEGKKLLKAIPEDEESISGDYLADDIINKKVPYNCLKALFMHVDETKKSIEAKKETLLQSLEKAPQFRSALFQLATCYLQLRRPKEAIATLEKLHAQDPDDITCEYYLAALYHDRMNDPQAYSHFLCARKIAAAHSLFPRPLRELQAALAASSPMGE